MLDGWVCIHRSLQKKGYYKDSEYVHLWLHFLLKANHEAKEFMFNGKMITVERGQFISGRKVLSKETGINQSKVRRIINFFKSDHQIDQQTSNKFSLFTVINYHLYQDNDQQEDHQATIKRPSSDHKQQLNNKTIINTSSKKKFSDEDMQASRYIFKKIQELNPNAREPNFDSWANTVRLMVERDNRTHREVCELFQWANNDPFWQSNILSPEKLRKQWDQLTIKKSAGNTNGKANNANGKLTDHQRFQQNLANWVTGESGEGMGSDARIIPGEVLKSSR